MKFLLMFLFVAFVCPAFAQHALFVPAGASGIGASGTANVGIGTSSPSLWFPSKILEISDARPAVKLTSTSPGGLSTIVFTNNAISSATHVGEFHVNHVSNQANLGNSTLRFNSYPADNILSLQANGKVGVGTATPVKKFHISGTGDVEQWIEATDNGFASLTLKSNGRQWHWSKRPGSEQDALRLFYHNGIAWSTPYLSVLPDGTIGIGTMDPKGYRLAIAGKAVAEEIVVKLQSAWPDYVFENTHKPMSLSELEQYIKENKHLPEVPSAEEVKENGLSVGEMNLLLLKKVEELTLHLIEQYKVAEEQRRKIESLEREMKLIREKQR